MSSYNISPLLLEVLKSASRMKVLRAEDFIISAPQVGNGKKGATRITLTPLESSNYYSLPAIIYNRFDLSELDPFTIPRSQVQTYYDVIAYINRSPKKRLFKYFIWNNDKTELVSRFLSLRERDFDDQLLPEIKVTTPHVILPREDSECFVGDLRIVLTL